MRFSSSLVAFAYLGFVAAAALPIDPTKPTSISASQLPERTPDLSARGGVQLPSAPVPSAIPSSPAGKIVDNTTGKKVDAMVRRKGSSSGGKSPSMPSGVPPPSPSVPVVNVSDNNVEGGKKGDTIARRKGSSSGGKNPSVPVSSGFPIPSLPPTGNVDASGNNVKSGTLGRREGVPDGLLIDAIRTVGPPPFPVPSIPV